MEEESLQLCQTDTGIFPCLFNNSSNKIIEVLFDGNVDVAKFTCDLFIYVPNYAGW